MVPIVTLIAPLVQALAPKFLPVLTDSDRGEEFAERIKNFVNSAVTPIDQNAPPETAKAQVKTAIQKIESDPLLSTEMLSMMIDAERDLTEKHLEDLKSARQFRLDHGEDSQSRWLLTLSFVLLGTIIVVVVAMAFLVPLLGTWVDDFNEDIAMQISGAVLGFLTGIGGMFARNIGSVFDFWFGSSAGSKAKSAQIGKELESRRSAPVIVETESAASRTENQPSGLEQTLADFRKAMSAPV
jgi:hypothetical protein